MQATKKNLPPFLFESWNHFLVISKSHELDIVISRKRWVGVVLKNGIKLLELKKKTEFL